LDELLKKLQGQADTGTGAATPGTPGQPGLGGMLGGMLGGGGLGGMLGGGVGGSLGGGLGGMVGGGMGAMLPMLLPAILGMLGGQGTGGQTGLHQLLGNLQSQGAGGVADSWVGTGENQPISAEQVRRVLGAEKLQQLSAQSNLPPEQVSEGLAAILPQIVDHLTPGGQVPSADELPQAISGLLAGKMGG
jgi:uncharacterized protein YidB (DUF937 family)